MLPRAATLALALALLTLPALAGGPSQNYSGAGVVVTAFAIGQPGTPGAFQTTIADNGAVVCDPANGSGQGGVCVPFGALGGDSVLVVDDQEGTDVAFQVCVDANGDSLCGGPAIPGQCEDLIRFSHSTSFGNFFNPLEVPPNGQAYQQACGGGGFPGYVVLICAGAHSDPIGGPHTHTVTQGTVQGVLTGGTGSGDFCGSPVAAKAYVVL